MNTISELTTMLKNIGEVDFYGWENVTKIIDFLNHNPFTIIERSADFVDENFLREKGNWSTYSGCCSMIASSDKGGEVKLTCDIFNGSSSGIMTTRRFKVVLIVSKEFLFRIEKYIEKNFIDFLSDQYEKMLELKKESWIKEQYIRVLNRGDEG